jgi:hypothetical protein
MRGLSGPERREALLKIGLLCRLRSELRYSEEEIATKLGFGSVEAMHTQLGHWGVPNWIIYGNQAVTESAPSTTAQTNRKGRSSSQAEEVPPASSARQLFNEAIDVLTRAAENLEHLTQSFQGGRFVGTYVDKDPVYFPRERFSSDEWRKLCELHGHDPDAEGFLAHGLITKNPIGASPTPPRPLVMLIAAYALADRQIEPLLEALHPEPSQADRERIRFLLYARKRKGGPDRDGLLRTAEQLAIAICGGKIRGAPPPDVPAVEHALACRITERREAGTPDEEIYQEMRHVGLSRNELTKEEFYRLANLRLRYPET